MTKFQDYEGVTISIEGSQWDGTSGMILGEVPQERRSYRVLVTDKEVGGQRVVIVYEDQLKKWLEGK